MKKRILLSVAYDGTGYAGYQAQKSGVPTIEGELNRALTELTGAPVEVIGASRTDAGVHARCNLAVFDTEHRMEAGSFRPALNVRLPEDIRIRASREVSPGFHPRKVRTEKRPGLMELFRKYPLRRLIVLRSREEASAWLEGLARNARQE